MDSEVLGIQHSESYLPHPTSGGYGYFELESTHDWHRIPQAEALLRTVELINDVYYSTMWQSIEAQYTDLRDQYVAIREAMAPLRLSKRELFMLSLRKIRHDQALLWSDLRESWHEISLGAQSAIIALLVLGIMLVLNRIVSVGFSKSR
ncbi:hypothetical protein F4779DRAFT_581746, partial [Xylariaceae sp. FL0662B]